jgi:hypothetical protein
VGVKVGATVGVRVDHRGPLRDCAPDAGVGIDAGVWLTDRTPPRGPGIVNSEAEAWPVAGAKIAEIRSGAVNWMSPTTSATRIAHKTARRRSRPSEPSTRPNIPPNRCACYEPPHGL